MLLLASHLTREDSYLNVNGGALARCSGAGMALTGFTRNGHCVDRNDDAGSHHVCINMASSTGGNFCQVTGQPDWCDSSMQCDGSDGGVCPVKHWCVCQWAFASYLQNAGGCDKIQTIVCEATNLQAFAAYEQQALLTLTAAREPRGTPGLLNTRLRYCGPGGQRCAHRRGARVPGEAVRHQRHGGGGGGGGGWHDGRWCGSSERDEPGFHGPRCARICPTHHCPCKQASNSTPASRGLVARTMPLNSMCVSTRSRAAGVCDLHAGVALAAGPRAGRARRGQEGAPSAAHLECIVARYPSDHFTSC